ncbi:putative Ig domain-containing protein [Spirosoma radiotolerans]|uniref:Dystroglycan-type cadherin-like domain-containing protein n=1 Tax=Spirosoma radiotolerans TaxID=1379870 RepID=A0A0E3V5I1_9BACT|nr:putative Ig domain-containing protein [Spirosoma radiotolerans]AKD53676.1 hypothetical protein SD10_00935 [Spirosoma radiotolerans]
MKKVIFLTILLSTPGKLIGQTAKSTFWTSANAYFGQTPPSELPQPFAPAMLVDSGIVMGSVVFSKNGREFYYGYAQSWTSRVNSGIKKRVFDGHRWSQPILIAETLNSPTLSPDENILYAGGRASQVWRALKTNGDWHTPVVWLGKPYGLYNFKPTNSGVFYVGSNGHQGSKADFTTYDICTLTMSKTDTVIQSLGIPVNTNGFEGDFYIAPDESYLILSANETPTFDSELYISFRKADKTWTNPKSLGPAINDGLAHRFGQTVTPDNKYLIYTKGTSEKDCKLYWIRFDRLLKRLKQTNYAPYLKKSLTNQVVRVGKDFVLTIPADAFVDDDTQERLTYRLEMADSTPLPSWLHLDSVKKTVSGKPTTTGTYLLQLRVTDSAGETAIGTFTLAVNP